MFASEASGNFLGAVHSKVKESFGVLVKQRLRKCCIKLKIWSILVHKALLQIDYPVAMAQSNIV